MLRPQLLLLAVLCWLPLSCGCHLIVPKVAHRPVIRNPFPQLRKVAVAPFFNQSDEPTLDGRQVALAYFAELQSTPGFEVVPLGVVEEAIIAHRVDLNGPGEARRLATILGVDALVVGAVTDFSEYYPPRVGLRVEWYTANSGYHEVPAGYGLPWGTPEEEFIPDSLVYESQMALARAEMAGLAPDCDGACQPLPAPPTESAQPEARPLPPLEDAAPLPADDAEPSAQPPAEQSTLTLVDRSVQFAQVEEELPRGDATGTIAPNGANRASGDGNAAAAPGAPYFDAMCKPLPLVPAARSACLPNNGPVLSHTKIYRGDDGDVTEALEGYVLFRDDNRLGGWKSYLARSDDYVRFCCHLHLCEMLSARGGSRKTQVVWRWPESR